MLDSLQHIQLTLTDHEARIRTLEKTMAIVDKRLWTIAWELLAVLVSIWGVLFSALQLFRR